GIEHGTVTVLANGDAVEITTFRKESGYSDHRRPDRVWFTASLEEDLSRRDFTINALAWHPNSGLIDLWDGLSDLKARVIRAVGDPEKRFKEDALRILRALRLSSELCFTIEEATHEALIEHCPLLSHVAMERFHVEFDRLLCGKGAASVLIKYAAVPGVIIPELRSFQSCMEGGQSLVDIAAKRLAAVRPLPPNRLAALLYDVNPSTTPGDDCASGRQVSTITRQLRYSKAEIKQIASLVSSRAYELTPETRSVWRALNCWGEVLFQEVMELREADRQARDPNDSGKRHNLREVQTIFETLIRDGRALGLRDLAIDGSDLLDLGCRKEMIGTILEDLLERICVDGLENRRDVLLDAASINACERSVSDPPHP
ncbi:MAG TPA: hypothetical protein VFD19_03190, partial [Clostridia bacterium]|nr:hypothetical protein [Clostridia bacterium]